ncbi:MAG: mRNA splicing protein prp18 [Vezdaea aestivalis]|nr:MAG: mRNA splicing protein prp18 [Vezdaea aestivalis]
MSFAALLAKEIAKGKPPSSDSTSKYVRRSELESDRQATYLAEQKALEQDREEKASKKRQREEDEAEQNRVRDEKRLKLTEESRKRREDEERAREQVRRKKLGLPDLIQQVEVPDEDDISEETLVLKLRELKEPIQLFGEFHKQKLKRYQRLLTPLTNGPIPTTLTPLPEAELKISLDVPSDKSGRHYLFRQLASYFTMILEEWLLALARRPKEVQESLQGKAAFNAMVQSRENMRPLFKKFEKGELEDSILKPVVEIIKAAQERRYVDANDGYLRLSIGKAAWPIGVTMVGIHERSAREKLHESETAHIMSDEVTRKFLQSIKRCLSFAQTRWPPDDQMQLMG